MLDDLEQYLDKDKAERGQELAEEFYDWVRATYEEGETDEWARAGFQLGGRRPAVSKTTRKRRVSTLLMTHQNG